MKHDAKTTALRVTVLISGSGTNLQALIDARDSGKLPIKLIHVISNNPAAHGLERARKAGVAVSVLPHGDFASRDGFDQALSALMAVGDPELVILAGFMRILGKHTVSLFQNRMINLHPSLLPLYRGTDTYRRAIEAGDQYHGASIHFVTGELDGGPVISQVKIPVEPGDTPGLLAERLAPCEHRLMVATTGLFVKRLIECNENEVYYQGSPLERPLSLLTDGSFLE